MDSHYHAGRHLSIGKNLATMMQRIHGSVAKLVNDILPERRVPFWREAGRSNDYYDGCFRDPLQCRRACRYTLKQAERASIVEDYGLYPHTRLYVDLEAKMQWALENHAFMLGVGYPRYDGRRGHR